MLVNKHCIQSYINITEKYRVRTYEYLYHYKSGLNAEIPWLGCLDQYAAQNSKYARPPIPSQPPTQKVFFQWHTQYDPTMKHSHCETVYVKELFQWLFFELVHSLRILAILPTYKLAGLTKECQWCK